MYEIRFHGRGGQGIVTASELLAVAAGIEGKYSQAFPFFGAERSGAPVKSFCRIDEKEIRIHGPINNPDCVIVIDPSLINQSYVIEGLKENGILIVNSPLSKKELNLKVKNLYVVDATGIALKNIGLPIANTAMLGAFAKASGVVKLESLKKAIEERFSEKIAEKNKNAIEECFNNLA